MSSAAQKKAVKEFKNVTSASDKIASEILSSHSWQLEEALDYFFSHRHLYPSVSSSTSTAPKVDQTKLNKLFDKYAAKSDEKEAISGEGLALLFTDMSIDPAGMLTLTLAYTWKCKNFGEISRSEFVNGMTNQGLDTIDKMKVESKRLSSLTNDPKFFKDFYRWLFDFLKEENDRKTIDSDAAYEMWSLILPSQWKLTKEWIDYCQFTKLKVVAKDLWEQVLEFTKEVKEDLSNHDPDGAWPVIIDEFVEYQTKNKTNKK